MTENLPPDFVGAIKRIAALLGKSIEWRLMPVWGAIRQDLSPKDREVHDFVTVLAKVIHAAEMHAEAQRMHANMQEYKEMEEQIFSPRPDGPTTTIDVPLHLGAK